MNQFKEFYKISNNCALLLCKYQIKIHIKIYNLKSLLKNTKVVCIAMKNFFIDNTWNSCASFLIENAENIDKSELYRISKNILSKRFKLFKISLSL